mmetsp:Transcript_21622/g.44588  ORF Transcript_21622/g.44588 Transcript_21622/m.44588 type:complete len:458 (-) Transcript_21622:592-1965(-)
MNEQSTLRSNRKSKSAAVALWITYINVALYALCYQLQRPVEPFLVESLTSHENDGTASSEAAAAAAATAYGRVQSFFSAIQTVGSPLVGILLDRIGIRRTSALVFAASALSYAILAHAADMSTLFISKVPTILQHAFLIAQATAATETGSDDALRAQALGRMTTAYTVGATVGPALGGFLAHGDEDRVGDMYLGARLAVLGSAVSVVLSWIFLPDERYQTEASSSPETSQQRGFVADVRRSAEIATRSHVWPLLLVKIVGGVARPVHGTALPLALTQRLDFDPGQLGAVMSSGMFAVAAFGAVALKPSTNVLGSAGLARLGLVFRGLMAVFIAHVISSSTSDIGISSNSAFMQICTAYIAHALASHALATSLTTMTTGAVSESERGALLGLEHGLFSAVGIFGPTVSTALFAAGGKGNFWSVALLCASIDVALVGALFVWGRRTRDQGSTGKDEHSD